MSRVQEEYDRCWREAGGPARVRRTVALYETFRSMLEFQVSKQEPGLSDRQVALRAARRMYLSDAAMQRLLDRLEKDVYDEHFRAGIEQIRSILDDVGIPYHLTGGLAASFYGEPRFTQDVDLVIRLEVGSPETEALLRRLASHYYIDRKIIEDAIHRRGMFQLLDHERIVKLDFHVGEKIPGELERSIRKEIFPGLILPLVAIEDSILSKLLWVRQGSGKSRSKRPSPEGGRLSGSPCSSFRRRSLMLPGRPVQAGLRRSVFGLCATSRRHGLGAVSWGSRGSAFWPSCFASCRPGFYGGPIPPTRHPSFAEPSSDVTDHTGDRPGFRDAFISFNIGERRFLPFLKAGASPPIRL